MRREIMLSCLAAVSLLAATAAGAEENPEVDEILARHAEAMGGADSMRVQSLKIIGTFNFNGIDSPYTLYRQRPDRFRVEIETSSGTVINAFDGETAWSQGPDRSGEVRVRAMEGDDRQRFVEENADFDGPLVDCAKKGHKAELAGATDVDGVATYHLKLSLKSGNVQEWFLSQDDYTVVHKLTPAVHRTGPYQRVWYLMEYQESGGVKLPAYVEREDRQHVRAYTIDKVEAGVELDEGLFVMPAPEP